MGLGSANGVSLTRAREKAALARQDLAEGKDPLDARKKARVTTFGEVADSHVDGMRAQWKGGKHAEQWVTSMKVEAAALRSKDVASIQTADVLEVLQMHWAKTPETASRLRGRIESVLDAAKAKGLRSGENPARWRGHLDQLLPKRQRLSRGHHAAMAFADVPKFMASLRARSNVSARALEFIVLTASRSGEAIGTVWDECDLEAGLWTVPAVRMKAGRDHRVPLCQRAIDILVAMKSEGVEPFVFPGAKRGRPLSDMAVPLLLRSMQPDVTTAGLDRHFVIGHQRRRASRMRSAKWP